MYYLEEGGPAMAFIFELHYKEEQALQRLSIAVTNSR
jgi:hypothetical protein